MHPGVPSCFQNYLAKWGRPGFSRKRPPPMSRGRAHTPFVVLSASSPELRSQTDVPTFTWSIVSALQNSGIYLLRTFHGTKSSKIAILPLGSTIDFLDSVS